MATTQGDLFRREVKKIWEFFINEIPSTKLTRNTRKPIIFKKKKAQIYRKRVREYI